MATLIVHKDLYFPDGNIVLNVVEDNQTMRFCVHKSVLSRNSPFFADMFGIPQPSENHSEMVEGCPAINLTGDTIDDWTTILGALYNVFFNQNQLPTSTIIAMLRLGKKYQFHDLEHDAQRRLRQWYPSTLAELRSRKQPSSCPFELKHSSELLKAVEEGIIPDDVLPVLYYEHLHLLNNFNNPDEEDDMTLVDEKVNLRLLIGHRRLLALQHQHNFACMRSWQPSSHCMTGNTCMNATKACRNVLNTLEPSGNVTIRSFITLNDIIGRKHNYCLSCASVVTTALSRGAAEVWRLLPWAFGLGSWKKLGKGAQYEEDDEEREESTDNH